MQKKVQFFSQSLLQKDAKTYGPDPNNQWKRETQVAQASSAVFLSSVA